MSDQQSSSSTQNMTIQLEIVPEDEQWTDIAEVDEVGRGIFDHFRESGYTISPAYTGRMGASPIYDVIIHTYHVIHDNQELLTAVFASVTAALALISKHNKWSGKEETTNTPLSIEITFPTNDNDKPLTFKAPDAETAIQLIEQLQKSHPEEVDKVTPQRSVNIKVRVPKKKRDRPH